MHSILKVYHFYFSSSVFFCWYFAFMIIQDNLYTPALGYTAIVLGVLFKNLHTLKNLIIQWHKGFVPAQ